MEKKVASHKQKGESSAGGDSMRGRTDSKRNSDRWIGE